MAGVISWFLENEKCGQYLAALHICIAITEYYSVDPENITCLRKCSNMRHHPLNKYTMLIRRLFSMKGNICWQTCISVFHSPKKEIHPLV
jgi:hypothetical protein